MKNFQKIARRMMLLVLVLTIGFMPALPAFAAYVDPPEISTNALTDGEWTHPSAGNYFWHPPAQQSEHPHFHLTGSTNENTGIVKIGNLSYTTGGTGNDIRIQFDARTGYDQITSNIEYQKSYNIKIDDLNQKLVRS